MSEEYNVQAIIDDLKTKEEMDPNKHDGCYELMRKTIEAYAKMDDLSVLDFNDLNLVYLTTVGTFRQGLSAKIKLVKKSHLLIADKESLIMLWNNIWDKADQGGYTNYEPTAKEGRSIGLFGTGFLTFKKVTPPEQVQAFIKMCIDILPMTEDEEMFNRAEKTLSSSIQGVQAAAASMMLHCLKPYTFPVLNANTGNRNVFEVIGVQLVKSNSLETYIDNCRRIKAYRDQNFSCKNYRIYDLAAQNMSEFKLAKVWLITWNKDNWRWDGFAEKCEGTKAGQTYVESWACSSTKPKIGDEVFLIKLGQHPKGLIGHGTVARELYEKDHFDTAKAFEGKKERAIDVEFDRLINYEKEKFVGQEELNRTCSAQLWSPQSSGIEIKPEVLPTLNALWKAVTETDETYDYWPSPAEYPVQLSKDDWKRFIKDIEAPSHKGCMRVLACFIDRGGIASPKTLSNKYKGHPSVYTSSVLNTSKRALSYFGMSPCQDGDTQRYFPIAFLGRRGKDVNSGTYEYKMRPELVGALQEMDLSGINLVYKEGGDAGMNKIEYDHNLILYGPPGTGKTYNSVIYAVAICEGRYIEDVQKEPYPDVLIRYRELQEAGRIEFTTFHQSYGYEEFIEGIKPKLNEDSETLGYIIENGVFKNFCKQANEVVIHPKANATIKTHPRIWGMLLGGMGSSELKKYCFENNVIRFGWESVSDDDAENYYTEENRGVKLAKHQVYDFMHSMEIGDVVVIAKTLTSVDAVGVITGEYEYDDSKDKYQRTRQVVWLVKDVDFDMLPYLPNGRKQLATSYLYLFDSIGMDVISQILNKYNPQLIETEQETKPYVFIIDEINRGNISKIFGELITLIEDTKRAGAAEAMEAILPYSGEPFSVPKNVYILGTMNTADRSIALMDTALRRRFEFKEMMPDSEVLESLGVGIIAIDEEELNVAAMLDVINQRIEYLFDREHTIGHAFFTKLADDPSLETLAGIFEKNVIPLLQEYFYEDYEKIQLVLGDNAKDDQFKFILDKPLKIKDIFSGSPDIDLPEKGYTIQHDAFRKLESYKMIGKDL